MAFPPAICCDAVTALGRAGARRQRLISVARTLFAEHGFNGTGMAQIASESGIKIGQIYRDFESKERLIGAIVEQDLHAFLNEAALRDAAAAGDLDAVRQWLVDFVCRDHGDEANRLIPEICAESARNERIGCIMVDIDRQVRRGLTIALALFAPRADQAAAMAVTVDLFLTLKIGLANQQPPSQPDQLAALRTRIAAIVLAEVDALAG